MVTKRYGVNLLFLSPGQVGGTQTYSQSLIAEMEKMLLPYEHLILYCCKNSQSIFKASNKIQIRVLPINSYSIVLRYLAEQILLPIMVLLDKIDVLLSLGYTQPILLSCKSIVTIHDLNWYYHPEDFTKIYRFFWKYLSTLSMIFSSHVIAVSSYTKKSIQKVIGIDSLKITTIHHGISDPIIYSSDLINNTIAAQKISKPYIMSVLSHYPHKNLSTLLTAYKMLRNAGIKVDLVIGGTGTSKDKRLRQNTLKRLNITGITLLPYLKSDDLNKIYQGATIFVFPSLYEGFGFPVLEAMSNQVPVICSDSSSLPEIVQNSTILFNPLDSNELFLAIKNLLESQSMRASLIKKGNSQYRKFTWPKTASKTLTVLRKYSDE